MNTFLRLTRMVLFVSVFLGSGVATAQRIPAPEELLGFKVGSDFHLASYQQAYQYFKALEQASPMLKVLEMGKTSMAKPMAYAVITSQANMAKLDRYKEISRRLSLAKDVTEAEAHALAAEGRVIVFIDAGIHASECAPSQHNLQLAYDLLTSRDAKTRQILDNVIFVLIFANPDGMDMLAEWYMPNVGTPFETSPMPWLYHKYIGHDNNRDFYMGNVVETRNLNRLTNLEWYPQVLYSHHQTSPFPTRIWIFPTSEPTNPNFHPLLVRWQTEFGAAMGTAFDRAGQPGAIARAFFDTWYPGYSTQVPRLTNVVTVLTETALYRYATPHNYTLDEFPEAYRDFTISTLYPSPWKGGWWRLKDAVDYCLTASKAVLQEAALNREDLLFDKYRMASDTIKRFKKEAPYAWIVPQQQWDPPTTALLLDRLRMVGVEVYKADQAFTSDGVSYPAGTWVVPMSQAFALYVKALFEEQRYPDLTKHPELWQGIVRPQNFKDAYLPPYDMAGWTLQYQFGVRVAAATSPLQVAMSPVDKPMPPGGRVLGKGAAYVISPKTNNSFLAVNRILKEGGEVLRASEPVTVEGEVYPPGAFVISKGLSPATAAALAKELSIDIVAAAAPVPAAKTAVRLRTPRVALYKSWTAQMDEGWTRWLLEQFEFPYKNIEDAEVKAGGLDKNYDVLIIPSMATDAIVNGLKEGTVPPQYAGGISQAGVANVKAFAEAGGTIVLLNNGTLFAIEALGIPTVNVLKGLKAPSRREMTEAKPVEFACPGSVVKMLFNTKHPVAYGMPEEAPAMFLDSPAFRIDSSFGGETVAKYPGANVLMSGYLNGEKYLYGAASVADVTVGKGHAVLLGFGVQQRGQPHGTFKLLFNSIYYGASARGGSKD